ncbi:MAG: response regulator [Bacillota bacterium]
MVSNTLKVLICDDSLLVRKKLKEDLEQCGCEILEASEGQAAIDMYKEHKPELVFMDIVMPVQDGIMALKEIKDHDPGARVVMVSSSGTQSHLKRALEAGADDFIQKPWEKTQIIAILGKVLKEKEGQNV